MRAEHLNAQTKETHYGGFDLVKGWTTPPPPLLRRI